MLTRLGQSHIGSGAQDVIPIATVEQDRLDVLTYSRGVLSMTAVQSVPVRRSSGTAFGKGYLLERLLSVSSGLTRILAYQPTTGKERFLKVDQQGSRWEVAALKKPMPDLPRDCTHVISGTKSLSGGVFLSSFVVGYSALTGTTNAFVWIGGPLGANRWLPARVASTTNLISPLPTGITAMTVLSVGNHTYLAFVVDGRLEVHDIDKRQDSVLWPAQSLVRTVDTRVLRYGPDGLAEVWRFQ